MILTAPLAALGGRWVLAAFASVGRITLFTLDALSHILRPPFYPREFLNALMNVAGFHCPWSG